MFGKKNKKPIPIQPISTQSMSMPLPPMRPEVQQTQLPIPRDSLQRLLNDPTKLVPGAYPPVVEAQVVRRMKDAATAKSKMDQWEEAYFLLRSVLRCEKVLLGEDHPEVANTLYYIGVALNFMGDINGSFSSLEEGIQILFPKRYNDKNVDLAALFYQAGIVKGKQHDYQAALYYLDLAKQVEIHLFGNVTDKTLKIISDYEYAKKASQRMNRIGSRSASFCKLLVIVLLRLFR